jgi:hypothetical protein
MSRMLTLDVDANIIGHPLLRTHLEGGAKSGEHL